MQPLELVHEAGRPLLFLKNFGGEPLDRLLGSPIELGHLLQLAIGIVAALGKALQRGILHKDIKRFCRSKSFRYDVRNDMND